MPPRAKVEIPELEKPELGAQITVTPEFVTTRLFAGGNGDSNGELAVFTTRMVSQSRPHVSDSMPAYNEARRSWINRPRRSNNYRGLNQDGFFTEAEMRAQSRRPLLVVSDSEDEDEETDDEEEEDDITNEEIGAERYHPFLKRPYDDSDDENVETDIDVISKVFGFKIEPVGEPKPEKETIDEREARRDRRFWATLRSYSEEVKRRLRIKRARNDKTESDLQYLRTFQE